MQMNEEYQIVFCIGGQVIGWKCEHHRVEYVNLLDTGKDICL